MGKPKFRDRKYLAGGFTADSASKFKPGRPQSPGHLFAFKTLVQGSWEPNLTRHPSENVAPRNKAPTLRELLVDTENHPAASVFPSCSPNTLDHLKRTAAQRLPLLVSAQARLMQDFISQRISSSVSDQLGICPCLTRFLASNPSIRDHPLESQ